MFGNEIQCIYKGCHLKCTSPSVHRAKYAYMNSSWKKKVENIDKNMKKEMSPKINWERLKQLGVIYNIDEIDMDKLLSKD